MKYEPKSACLNLTDACCCRCIYCFVTQQPHYMTLDMAQKCIDFAYNKGIRRITFFGGEPTLLFDEIIVPIVENNKYQDLKFDMTTNGTLLTKERIDWLYKNNIGLLLSIDGDKETQDYNRPLVDGGSSFDKIIKIVPYLLEKYPNITFRATISQDTVHNMFDNYIFAINTGFKHIFFAPNSREKWTEENMKILEREISKIFTYNMLILHAGFFPRMRWSQMEKIFTKVLKYYIQEVQDKREPLEVIRDPRRCGLGTTSLSFGYDGKIYGCQEQDSKGVDSQFYIGDIFNGIDEEKHQKLLQKYTRKARLMCENPFLCKECKLRYQCHTLSCPSTSIDLFDDPLIESEVQCRMRQAMFHCADNMIKIMGEKEKHQAFHKWLYEICGWNEFWKAKEGETNVRPSDRN